MPQQYVVPQFIEVEDKIIGPITVRQFVILLGTGLVLFILYKLPISFLTFIFSGLPFLAIGITFSFVRINGQPFHLFFLNLVQTSRRPNVRIWFKDVNDKELMAGLAAPPKAPAKIVAVKESMSTSRLQELSLIANTGGVYRPEDWK